MKNLLIIVPGIGFGGQERIAVDTAKIFQDKYIVTMVIFNEYKDAYSPNCPVIHLNVPASPNLAVKIRHAIKRVQDLKKIKRDLGIDISLSFGNTANYVNSLSKGSEKIILSIHGYKTVRVSFLARMLNSWIYSKADYITCVSEKISRDLLKNFIITPKKVVTVYNPYDFDSIVQQKAYPVEFPVTHPAIVTMGRMERVKGYSHLLRAFRLVKEEVPEASLVFIGDGSLKKELQELTSRMALSQDVIFTGLQTNPHQYLSKCDVYVLTSIHEGFPNALVEAMVCGLPVIATDCKSGPREILTEPYHDLEAVQIEYGEFGVLAPPFSSDDSIEPEKEQALAEAIIELITNNEIRRNYQQKSEERARVFSFQAYQERLIALLDSQD